MCVRHLHSAFDLGMGPTGGGRGAGGRGVCELGRTKSQNQESLEKSIVKGKEMGILLGKLLPTESCFRSLSHQGAGGASPDPEFLGEL